MADKPEDTVWLPEIAPLLDFEELDTIEKLFDFRLHIEEAIAQARKAKSMLDNKLLDAMKENGVESFEYGMEENKIVVSIAKEKKDSVNTEKLISWLKSEDEAERDMALKCLAGGQSAWKPAMARLIQDSIGCKDLCKTTWYDKVKLSAIPKKTLERLK